MLPREHGAYGQLLFPLGTALVISGLHPAALLTAAAAVAAFVAHEPAVVLLGGRGVRARVEQRDRAVKWLAISVSIAAVAGISAIASAPAHVRWLFAWPLTFAVVLGALLFANREKTTPGEVTAAISFASVAIPLCAMTAETPLSGFTVAFAFASLFIIGTLAVRIVILRTRGGGDPRAVRSARIQLAMAIMVVALGIPMLAAAGAGIAAVAVVPGLLVAIILAVRPPHARRLRTIGWTLLSMTALLAMALAVSFA